MPGPGPPRPPEHADRLTQRISSRSPSGHPATIINPHRAREARGGRHDQAGSSACAVRPPRSHGGGVVCSGILVIGAVLAWCGVLSVPKVGPGREAGEPTRPGSAGGSAALALLSCLMAAVRQST